MPIDKGQGDDIELAAVDKALGEPVMAFYDDNALKVRRNLLVAGVLGFVITQGHVRLDPSAPVMGFKLLGLGDQVLWWALIASTAYLTIHFFWCAWESFFEWRIRITGTRVSHQTTAVMSDEYGDYPSDPRMSTLYHWWRGYGRRAGDLPEIVRRVDQALADVKAEIDRLMQAGQPPGGHQNVGNVQLAALQQAQAKLQQSVLAIQEATSSARIEASLRRFDRWYLHFNRSQMWRWASIETGLPLALGIYAIASLACAPPVGILCVPFRLVASCAK